MPSLAAVVTQSTEHYTHSTEMSRLKRSSAHEGIISTNILQSLLPMVHTYTEGKTLTGSYQRMLPSKMESKLRKLSRRRRKKRALLCTSSSCLVLTSYYLLVYRGH